MSFLNTFDIPKTKLKQKNEKNFLLVTLIDTDIISISKRSNNYFGGF